MSADTVESNPKHSRATFRARVLHRPTEDGGHRTPIYLGSFRPDSRFPFDRVYLYGTHFLSEETVAPGDTFESDVFIRTGADVVLANVEIGTTFGVMEGSRQVADGVITAIYPQNEPPE